VHYWINADRESGRAQWMRSQFVRTGLRHRRVAAHTAVDLPPMRLPRAPRATPPQLACLASHFAALRAAYDAGEEAFVVLEDDMCIAFALDFGALLDSAPRRWEILQLYVVNPDRLRRMHAGSFARGRLWERWHPRNFSTGAYVCSRRGAERILGRFSRDGVLDFASWRRAVLADHLLYRAVRSYTITYPLFVENAAFGTTLGSRTDFHAASHEVVAGIWRSGAGPAFAVRLEAQPA
jgi:GR25 family glycosyltransferase involved in LPS biosynthesis